MTRPAPAAHHRRKGGPSSLHPPAPLGTTEKGLYVDYPLLRKDYSHIGIHQFLRAKVLRQLFLRFPDAISPAKNLDAMKDDLTLPRDDRLYVAETNLAVFGGSPIGGRVTRNCATSLRALGLGLPLGFEESDTETVMGILAEPGPLPAARA